jgi:CBS domain-containing protein
MNLGELFRSDVATAAPDDPIRKIAQTMKDRNVGAVVIVKNSQVAGIVTDRDLALSVTLGKATPDSPVRDVMTRKVVTIWADQGVFNATQYFQGHQFRRLPIVSRDNKLVGIVTLDDLLTLLSRELFNVCQAVAPAVNAEEQILERAAEPMVV